MNKVTDYRTLVECLGSPYLSEDILGGVSYLVVEFGVLLVVQYCSEGVFGEQRSSRSAIDALWNEGNA